MNLWDNKLSLQEKYGNFIPLLKLSEWDKIFSFIKNYICHLCNFNSFNVIGEDSSAEDEVIDGENSSDVKIMKDNIDLMYIFWNI